jgi:signal transduction histidine kinase/ActR/RegA family two-component response regulator
MTHELETATRSCEFCGAEAQELAHTRKYVWVGCRRCLRIWKEDAEGAAGSHEGRRPAHAGAAFLSTAAGRYFVAASAVALAFGVRLSLTPIIANASPFLLFTPAVMAAAWQGGVWPALGATGAGAVLGNFFFLRTVSEPVFERGDRIAMFLLASGLIIIMTSVVKGSRRELKEGLWREQKARAEAEAANQTKDDFLNLVSHELQTPVSVVAGWASAIRRRHLRGDALDLALEAIERNAEVQSRLVQDILDRARIVTGRLRLEPRLVSLTEILRAAVAHARPLFDHNHVQLTTRIADSPRRLSADPVRLQQVFTNLLSNAAKFTPPGGHVEVAASYTDSLATVTIADDGVGISPELLPRVFEGLRQDVGSAPGTSKGLGLGLSIARHFVERHGGMIRAASAGAGQGSTFTVVLPIEPEPEVIAQPDRREASRTALSTTSVLLVENDDDARLLLTRTLEYYGASVVPVASAADAVRVLEQHRADVLLSDIETPAGDSLDLIRQVRAQRDPGVASTPAAAITASPSAEERHHAIAAGYQLQLQKPVDPDELVSAILTLAHLLRNPPRTLH